jgi:hypothetical protein
MGTFERRFVRPSRFSVVDALEQAATEANEALHVVETGSDHWNAFLADIHEEPEGFRQWHHREAGSRAGVVGLAWWTDHLRRRHFRVWAGSSADGSYFAQLHPEHHPLPPLWHVAPDRIFERMRHGQREWLAACPCGMVGTPQAIGWMGTCCGVCHYSKAESLSEPAVHTSRLTEADVPLRHLGFSPDGRWLVGAGESGQAHLWDLAAGAAHTTIELAHGETEALAFSPDGRLLARAGSDRMLRFFAVETGAEISAYPSPKSVQSVVIAPDDLTLAIVAEKTFEVWGRPEASLPWLPTYVREGAVYGAAFDRRGDRIAASLAWEVVVLRIPERAGCPSPFRMRHLGSSPEVLGFQNDGRHLALLRHDTWNPQNGALARSVAFWDVELNQEMGRYPLHCQSAVHALSLDAEWLAGTDGAAVVVDHMRGDGRWFKLDCGRRQKLEALAFSPDGQTLATADAEGAIKLWPWRKLGEV